MQQPQRSMIAEAAIEGCSTVHSPIISRELSLT